MQMNFLVKILLGVLIFIFVYLLAGLFAIIPTSVYFRLVFSKTPGLNNKSENK